MGNRRGILNCKGEAKGRVWVLFSSVTLFYQAGLVLLH